MSDPYVQLDLPPSADETEIRRRDLNWSGSFRLTVAERFAEILAAYDALRDPVSGSRPGSLSRDPGPTPSR